MDDGFVVRLPHERHRCQPPMCNLQPWIDGAVAVEGTVWECGWCGRQWKAVWPNLWPYRGAGGAHRAKFGVWQRKWWRARR